MSPAKDPKIEECKVVENKNAETDKQLVKRVINNS
jgi:hypothetical protein